MFALGLHWVYLIHGPNPLNVERIAAKRIPLVAFRFTVSDKEKAGWQTSKSLE